MIQRSILLVAAITIGFISCKSVRKEKGDSFSAMDEFFDQHKQQEQEFVLDTGGTGPIIGKMGTRLYADSSIFMYSNGNDVPYPIVLKLIELYPRKDIILYRTPTISGGQVLRSGGEIRLRAFKDGQELLLKPGKTLLTEMPSANPENGMQIFMGETEVPKNWIATNDSNSVSNVPGYYQLFPKQLGWINCDRFYNYTGAKTTLTAQVDGTGAEYISIFIVFKGFLSVLEVTNLQSSEIPVGEQVVIIAMAKDQGGNFRLHQSDETIAAGMTVTLDMQEVTEQQLLDALGGL